MPSLPPPLFWLAALLVILAVATSTKSRPAGEEAGERGHHGRFPLHASRIDGVAFSPDGGLVATASSDGTTRISDLATRREWQVGARESRGFAWVAFSPVDRTMASGNIDGRVAFADLRDCRTSRGVRVIAAGPGARCGVFSPDGGSLAVAGDDRVVRIWDARTGLVSLAAPGHLDSVRGLAFTPDGESILSAAADGSAILRDARTGRIRGRCDPDVGPLWSVAISPDGLWAALGGRNSIALWSLADGRSVALKGCEGTITSLAFLPSGTTLASAGFQCPTTLWERQGAVLRHGRTLAGHDGHVKAMAVSPDGKILAAGDGYGILNVWNL